MGPRLLPIKRRGEGQRAMQRAAPERAIAVILSACLHPFLPGLMQNSSDERRRLYESVVHSWATNTSLPVVFVENSMADLASLRRLVPPHRRATFEFLSFDVAAVVRAEGGKSPERHRGVGELNHPGIGAYEARSILHALRRSELLRRVATAEDDLLFSITGRYFVHDFERTVRRRCWPDAVRSGKQPWPQLALQNPSWTPWKFEGQPRQETSCLGFVRGRAFDLLGWSELGWAGRDHCFECHVSRVAREARRRWGGAEVCELPSLPITPTVEGSTLIKRESL